MHGNILIVDDEEGIRFSLRGILEDEGHEVEVAESGEQALEILAENRPDILFLDIWLPGMDGLQVLDHVHRDYPNIAVIMISGHGNIETAVTALKKGAFDFIEKPLSLEKVVAANRNALEFARLKNENEDLKRRINSEMSVRLTGESEPIQSLRGTIAQVAPVEAWVLITGENGTGKEIVARTLHQQSNRSENPMVAVNCAAIPEELIEAELFGYEKGAFTGADKSKTGKFELANKGTLFLDEIGDMSMKTQAKILRILQEQRFERVGGHKTIKVDVRVFAATNKDLPHEISAGNFREDLYYRLKVIPLVVPPLRHRISDIPLLIKDFVDSYSQKLGFKPMGFTDTALECLTEYPWPGNVRELKNFVERMMIMHSGKTVAMHDLPTEICSASMRGEQTEMGLPDHDQFPAQDIPSLHLPKGPVDIRQARADFESEFLRLKLQECEGNVSRLAKTVGLERSSLYRKLKSYNIQID